MDHFFIGIAGNYCIFRKTSKENRNFQTETVKRVIETNISGKQVSERGHFSQMDHFIAGIAGNYCIFRKTSKENRNFQTETVKHVIETNISGKQVSEQKHFSQMDHFFVGIAGNHCIFRKTGKENRNFQT